MNESPPWATASGLPSRHIVDAAMHVASTVDSRGSLVSDTNESYWHRATGGYFPPADLVLGQALLLDTGLLVKDGELLHPTAELSELLASTLDNALAVITAHVAAFAPVQIHLLDTSALSDLVPDPNRRDELLLRFRQRFDDDHSATVGDAGERLVVAELRAELEGLGRPDLAREVLRVSLISDQLGYDVRAPRLHGQPRRLEVKATTTVNDDNSVRIFVSRNEVDTGMRIESWSLVVCHIIDPANASGSILGWWSYDDLVNLLPEDGESSLWRQAELTLFLNVARPGFPTAIH